MSDVTDIFGIPPDDPPPTAEIDLAVQDYRADTITVALDSIAESDNWQVSTMSIPTPRYWGHDSL